jgi:hypothetical protein
MKVNPRVESTAYRCPACDHKIVLTDMWHHLFLNNCRCLCDNYMRERRRRFPFLYHEPYDEWPFYRFGPDPIPYRINPHDWSPIVRSGKHKSRRELNMGDLPIICSSRLEEE